MSQLILLHSSHDLHGLGCIPLTDTVAVGWSDHFLATVTGRLFPSAPQHHLWTQKDFHRWCELAIKSGIEEPVFTSTRLCRWIHAVYPRVETMALWYSDYYENLPVVSSEDALIAIIREALQAPCFEIYACTSPTSSM